MGKKLSYEEVYNLFKEKGYTLLEKEYKNNQIPLLFIDKKGYKSTISVGNLKLNRTPCYFSKRNIYSIENIQKFLNEKQENVIVLSKIYEGNDKLLCFKCSCGSIFYRTWADMSTHVYTVCKECSIKKRGMTKRNSIEDIEKIFNEKGYILLSRNYKTRTTYLECEDKEGYRGFLNYAHLLQGSKISRFDLRVNSKYYQYNVNHYALLNGISSRMIGFADNELWSRKGIKIKCECGEIFETSISSFMNGKERCDSCTKRISLYEQKIIQWLNKNKVKYIRQYRFEDCKNILPLPFDFYLEKYNTLIEIDGEGHYQPAYFNHCSYEKAVESYERAKINDNIKNNYCKENEIKLVRIPYWDIANKKYKDILTNIIKN